MLFFFSVSFCLAFIFFVFYMFDARIGVVRWFWKRDRGITSGFLFFLFEPHSLDGWIGWGGDLEKGEQDIWFWVGRRD